MIYVDLNPKVRLKPQMTVNNNYFNVQNCETGAGGNGARSRGPIGACRFTKGEIVVVRRGILRSFFSSVLTQQGNTGEETAWPVAHCFEYSACHTQGQCK